MKFKFYLLSALLGGLVIFIWGMFAHMALPWWEDVMLRVPNEQAVVDAMKSNGVQNGMYYGVQGMFLVTFFGQGMADNGQGMRSYMVKEFISDALLALILAWLLLRANARGLLAVGVYSGFVGLAGWLNGNVSNWIWYHFPFRYIALEALDQIIGVFLAGLVIAWLMNKQQLAGARNT